jgi:hypothetical protein
MYTMGRSFPIGPWLRTAPVALLLASVVRTNGSVRSGYYSNGSVVISLG